MPRKSRPEHNVGLRTNDPVNRGGRNGRVSAPIPGSNPDACWIQFEDGGYERHISDTLNDGHVGKPSTGWC